MSVTEWLARESKHACPDCPFRTSDVDLLADHLMDEHNETFRDLVLEGGAP